MESGSAATPPAGAVEGCSWRLVTPAATGGGAAGGRLGAIAVVELVGAIDPVLQALGAGLIAPGQVGLRGLAGVDQGVIARFGPGVAYLMVHAGPAVVRLLISALLRHGIPEARERDPRDAFPEAESLIEARMLQALSRARSSLAIDLLLDQPRRWSAAGAAVRADPVQSGLLRRLIDPPLVVALGHANIGKSSLLNALARRSVSLVADEPGTTRDHVGATLDLAGLVVRYVDTPGVSFGAPADPISAAAQQLSLTMTRAADLVILCADSTAGFLEPPNAGTPLIRVGLRADLGPPRPGPEAHERGRRIDAVVSVQRGEGLEDLARLIRDTLIPPAALRDPGPWQFWDDPENAPALP